MAQEDGNNDSQHKKWRKGQLILDVFFTERKKNAAGDSPEDKGQYRGKRDIRPSQNQTGSSRQFHVPHPHSASAAQKYEEPEKQPAGEHPQEAIQNQISERRKYELVLLQKGISERKNIFAVEKKERGDGYSENGEKHAQFVRYQILSNVNCGNNEPSEKRRHPEKQKRVVPPIKAEVGEKNRVYVVKTV